MILVDPEQWQSAQLNNVVPSPSQRTILPDPISASISSLDQTMQNILTNNEHDDDYTKAQLYSQALQRYLTLADKYRNKPLGKFEIVEPKQTTDRDTPSSTSESVETDKHSAVRVKRILQSTLPPTLRSKGLSLLDHLTTLPGVSWDSKQQLVVDDKTITQSNIVDIVNDLVRDRKTYTSPPKGWNELADVLTKTNVPKALINNSIRRQSLTQNRLSRIDQTSKRKSTDSYKVPQNQSLLKSWLEKR